MESQRRYVYRIKAVNAHGESDRSSWARGYTPAAPGAAPGHKPPARPTGLAATPSHDSVVLTWNDPSDAAISGYVILRRDKDLQTQGTFQTISADTGTADTSYLDASVDPERRYVYRIKAINTHGDSNISNWARGYTPAAPQATLITGNNQDHHDDQSGDTHGEEDTEGTDPPHLTSLPAQAPRANVPEGDTDLPDDDTTTGEVDVGGSVTGNIEPIDDVDSFSVHLEAGKLYQIDAEGEITGHGTLPDPFLALYDGSFSFIFQDDDDGEGLNSRLSFTPTATGTHYLTVKDARSGTGTYTLSVRDITPSVDQEAGTTLLSNFGQTDAFLGEVEITSGINFAQGFTTGSNVVGYYLGSIELDVVRVPGTPSDVSIALWSATSGSAPDAPVAALTHSTGTWTAGANRFHAPADTELDADTTYFVHMAYSGGAPGLTLTDTGSASAVGGTPDWRVGQRFWLNDRSTDWRESLGAWFVFRINGTAADPPPVITRVAVTSTPGLRPWLSNGAYEIYGQADDIEITVTFSEAVAVTGDPVFEFCIGAQECEAGNDPPSRRRAALTSGSGTDTLVFTYTVGSDDQDSNGIWIGDQTRTLKLDTDDAIRSVATGANAVLDHPALRTRSGHKVDGSQQGAYNHTHQEFTHSHAHFNDGKKYYTEDYPDHTHPFHRHSNDPPHPAGLRPGLHVHHAQENLNLHQGGPDISMHDDFTHTHICSDLKPSCNVGDNFITGRYGGVLPREVTHSHADSEPGHGYVWPDLTADGNRPAEREPYVGWGAWRVAVGTTLSVDMWRVSDPDGMSNATLRYQWLADYTEIPAATGATYTVTAADVGKKIRVRVSFTDDAGHEEVLRSRDTLTAVTGGP